ncbi:MAG: manganese efflux pump, partial [Alphaproteobacteria bacterium]|nr:manganese efflux pump [Alphaproteobacteria bacterium]
MGAKVGKRFRSKAEIVGGVILVALGAKILIE